MPNGGTVTVDVRTEGGFAVATRLRRRARHPRRRAQPHLRAVLHDEAQHRRHRPRALGQPRHRRGSRRHADRQSEVGARRAVHASACPSCDEEAGHEPDPRDRRRGRDPRARRGDSRDRAATRWSARESAESALGAARGRRVRPRRQRRRSCRASPASSCSRRCATRRASLPVVLVTGAGTYDTLSQALTRGAAGLVTKPFSHAELRRRSQTRSSAQPRSARGPDGAAARTHARVALANAIEARDSRSARPLRAARLARGPPRRASSS